MCFYADYDWYPNVVEEAEGPSPARQQCDECHDWINAGEWRYDLHQERHESCLHCDPGEEFDDYFGRGGDGKCDHGKTADYVCCERCWLLRKAIRQVEEREGCTGNEAEPPLEFLYEAVGDAGGWDEYAPKMLALGLIREYALIPAPDPEDIAEAMVNEYPELHDDWGDETGDFELGGEAG